ncbi:DUF4272 domain-containing protein [Desulfoluna spongiiphila]|uniref:DUF4272 domain-containing protein n=1 Tax=Desulfoluna spongiiphila TaxID=419481 RepID=A0A1G5ARM6_9BACT|nr:DUF4272 domain-containing protein [Desulfoluna spongiiphila]SCX80490.1 protein of unknown function [Desulfoluna spongiiphila]
MFGKLKYGKNVRKHSWDVAKSLGYPVNLSLPLLESELRLRPLSDIVNRILVLNVVCAHSYGFQKDMASQWVTSENIENNLSPLERSFLYDGNGDKNKFGVQVEAMWAFLWCLNIISDLKFNERCSDNTVKMVPDLKNMQPSTDFKSTVSLRNKDEIVNMLDLVYCLNWGQKQHHLDTGKWNYPPDIIEERRRALEWSLRDVEWDEITLDT